MSGQPVLNERARGWLRFIWDKATTPDDWSVDGEPHPWWDKATTAPMCAFPRFDLSETSYALPMLVDQTPAWREVYTRIADELVGRYTTFWGAIDWITLLGHDPHQGDYPPEWQVYMPEHLRGRYDPPGWTANGVEPWGLQPDPIGADGNLFFRGFFNLLLNTYSYVSGDNKWERPFRMTGVGNRLFEWTQPGISSFIEDQWADRPMGAHCENTKIWPYCLSAAGLSLQLHDKVFGTSRHWVYEQWIEYAKKHFAIRDSRGNIESFAFYYDPLEQFAYNLPDKLAGYGTLAPLFYLYPQAPAFGRELYESGIRKLGWNAREGKLVQPIDDPRWLTLVLMLARELGDATTERRLTSVAEREYGPDFFAEDPDRFAWRFGLDEPWPRGQLNGLMILSEIGERGAWSNVYTGAHEHQFDLPTVEGVDFPRLGISAARNDRQAGILSLQTYAATDAARGQSTSWRITQLPGTGDIEVHCNGALFPHWRVVSDSEIEIEAAIGPNDFSIRWARPGRTALPGSAASAPTTTDINAAPANASMQRVTTTTTAYRPAMPPTCCPCC